MRFVFKLLLVSVGTVVVLLIASLGWLYLDSRDLPDIETLTRFSPQAAIEVSDACLAGNFLAIPYDSIGHNLHAALNAAEVSENDPGALTTIYREFKGDQRLHRATLSTQISRTMFCSPSKQARRHLQEVRTAIRLEQHFSRQQLFTIFSNRAYFGRGVIGIQAAAQHFFGKDPHDLTVVEAALMAGLLKSPTFYSAVKHREHALERRNEIIDIMVKNGSISASEGENAKAAPLQLAAS